VDRSTDPHPDDVSNQHRRRATTVSSVAHSMTFVTRTVRSATSNLLQKSPPLGFSAAAAQAASNAPTIADIRKQSFRSEGWNEERQAKHMRRTTSESGRERPRRSSGGQNGQNGQNEGRSSVGLGGDGLEPFPALVEEPMRFESVYETAQDAPTAKDSHQPRGENKDVIELCEQSSRETPTNPHHTTLYDEIRPGEIRPLSKDHKVFSSGYIPPPVIPWTTSAWIALKSFVKWFLTPLGFFITIYGLNVVAWGGMLFLLLCNASSAMCWSPIHTPETEKHMSPAASLKLNSEFPRYYNCNDINSPRRVWIEIDSQILNALFCVTGYGLAPWRFRDLWWLLKWRLATERRVGFVGKMHGLRVLAGIHRGWFRLPGSHTMDSLSLQQYLADPARDPAPPLKLTPPKIGGLLEEGVDVRLPLPVNKKPDDPLTGVRAAPTALWKMDFFVWSQVWNTFFQVCLCGFMWGRNRYNRPPWATGLFVALACIVVAAGGVVSFVEGRRVGKVEGVPAKAAPEEDEEGGRALELRRVGTEGFEVHGVEIRGGK